MSIGNSMYVPMSRSMPVRAGGGIAPSIASPTAPTPAPMMTASTPPTTPGLQSLSMKVQTFFSNLWDSLVSPLLKNFLGMFGMGN